MVTIKLSYAGKQITIPKPTKIDDLSTIAKKAFDLTRPIFKYLDEDNEALILQMV